MRKFTSILFVLLATGTVCAQVAPTSPSVLPSPEDINISATTQSLDPALISATGTRTATSKARLDEVFARTGTRSAPAASAFGPPCTIPACGGIDENEPCGDSTNNGCVADYCTPAQFIAAAPGSYCGTVFAENDLRDLDYYQIDSVGVETLSATLNSEFASNLILIESLGGPANCDGLLILDIVEGGACTPVTLERTLVAATTYYLVVTTGDAAGPIFNGVPCGTNNAYQLDIAVASADCGACAGGAAEIEVCGADSNGGCNDAAPSPAAYESITAGLATCGTLRTFFDTVAMVQNRDTDWYDVSALAAGAGTFDITVDLTGEAPTTAFILQDTGGPADCGTTGALLLAGDAVFSSSCNTSSGTFTVNGGGTYYLFVSTGDEFGALFDGIGDCTDPANDYSVTVNVAPAACPTLCALPGGGVPEGEPCPANPFDPDTFNGGCNSGTDPLSYSLVAPGTVIDGVSWADSGTRDTDWYRFTVPATGASISLDITLTSNVPVDFFVLGNELDPGAFDALPDCGLAGGTATFNVVGSGNAAGDCTATTITATLNPDALIGFSDYVIFVGAADAVTGPIFSGFPCVCGYGYQLEIGSLGGPPCTFPTGLCDSDCSTGDLVFDLVAPVAYDNVEIVIDDIDGNNVGTINTGPLPVGPFSETFTPPADGVYAVTINATCAGGAMAPVAACVATVWTIGSATEIIFDGDPDGCIDSAAALETALVANGKTVLVIDNGFTLISDYDCLADAENIWIVFGTFPNNFAMAPAEGTILNAGVQAGTFNVYLEGGDVWGFDAPTSYFDVDGVDGLELDGTLIVDGDDTLTAMNGSMGALVDTMTPFSQPVPYDQDNLNPSFFLGDDFTDQLIVSSGTDLPAGRTFESIWTQDGVGYTVGVAGGTPNPLGPVSEGKVISTSFEFGGFGADQTTLAGTYLGFFTGGSTGPEFKRGDCNADGGFNIADEIYMLAFLFSGGPAGPCDDACDQNDDGSQNIADAIYGLAALFSGGPLPPAPGPSVCGEDATDTDPLGCAVYNPCP